MIHARIENGQVVPLTPEDAEKFARAFPDGEVHLNSENCPEVAAAINKISDEILNERQNLYRRLANVG